MVKAKEDTREVKIRQYVSVTDYKNLSDGFSTSIKPFERPPTDEEREQMCEIADQYIAGNIELISSREIGRKCLQRRKHRYMVKAENSKGQQVWQARECALELKYIAGLKLVPRNDQFEETDWKTNKKVVPRLFISASDGSSGAVLFKPKRKFGKKTSKTSSAKGKGPAPIPSDE